MINITVTKKTLEKNLNYLGINVNILQYDDFLSKITYSINKLIEEDKNNYDLFFRDKAVLTKELNYKYISKKGLVYLINEMYLELYLEFKDKKYNVKDYNELETIISYTLDNSNLNNLDVSNIYNMNHLFSYSKFNGDISKWDVSNVINMNSMFFYSKFNGDISEWDVSNVINMYSMFFYSEFNGDLSKWDTSNSRHVNLMSQTGKKGFCTYTHNLNLGKKHEEREIEKKNNTIRIGQYTLERLEQEVGKVYNNPYSKEITKLTIFR